MLSIKNLLASDIVPIFGVVLIKVILEQDNDLNYRYYYDEVVNAEYHRFSEV